MGKMTKEEIINTVCEVCGVTVEQLRQRSRREPLPTARALISHFLHEELRMSPREILPFIGHSHINRTAIYHYLGKKTLVEKRLPFQKQLREKTEQIQKLIMKSKDGKQPKTKYDE